MDGLKPKAVSKVSSLQIPHVSQRLQPQPPAASTSAAGSRLKLEQSAADAPLEPARNKLLTRLRVNGNKRGKAKILVDNPSTSSAGRKFRTIAKVYRFIDPYVYCLCTLPNSKWCGTNFFYKRFKLKNQRNYAFFHKIPTSTCAYFTIYNIFLPSISIIYFNLFFMSINYISIFKYLSISIFHWLEEIFMIIHEK